MWCNRKHKLKDGSNWSVLPDWEATKGMHNDVMSVSTSLPMLPYELEDRFKGDMFFELVIHHLSGRDSGSSVSEH
jgi:hypothetical protein